MFEQAVIIEDDALNRWVEGLSRFPGLTTTAMKRQVSRLGSRLRRRLKDAEPRPAVHPFVWSLDPAANARARAYYFGVILKGKKRPGGRYVRTGKMLAAFKVRIDDDDEGGILTVTNPTRAHLYTMGKRQVVGHKRTGWPKTRNILDDFEGLASEAIRETAITVMDEFAGVPR